MAAMPFPFAIIVQVAALSTLHRTFCAALQPLTASQLRRRTFSTRPCRCCRRPPTRCGAEDLEDVFPHIPFPSDYALFLEAVEVGREIRAVETFGRSPGAAFLTARAARIETEATGTLDASGWSEGELFLCANRTGRVSGISAEVWAFEVSGYRLLFRWLDARKGLPVDHALITGMRDVVGRIAELIDLFARADHFLERALPATLSCEALGISESDQPVA